MGRVLVDDTLRRMSDAISRCPWASAPLDVMYHDNEWGVPVRTDDAKLFEMLTLEGAQAGLSWSTILKKREGYRHAFHGFDPARVARMGEHDMARLLGDPGIVRHRGKIESTISNAAATLRVQDELGSLCDYIWSFVDGVPIVNEWARSADVPSETPLSKRLSKDLRGRGFRFVGPTTAYALMQACGMVNDHLVSCPRWKAVQG